MDRRQFLQVVTAGAVAGCSSGSARERLVVGMELGYPPFEMTDEKGQPAGVSIDLARELSAAVGRELKIENLAFDGLIPALKTGTIDLIISSLTKTAERAASIDFSDPYLETGLCLLLAKDSPVQTVKDLDQPGRKVAVKKGTTGNAYAAAHFQSVEILVLDQESAAVLEVVQGKVDAFIYDQLSVFQHGRRNPETTRTVLQPFQKEQWAIGVRKGNDPLRLQVNAFLAAFRQRGGFDRLGERWLKVQKDAFKERGLDFIF